MDRPLRSVLDAHTDSYEAKSTRFYVDRAADDPQIACVRHTVIDNATSVEEWSAGWRLSLPGRTIIRSALARQI